MVASDTIVGVVGAVLLLGVMVGVFAYEYNNTPVVDGSEPPATGTADEDFQGTLDPNLGVAGPAVLAEQAFAVNASATQLRVTLVITPNVPAGNSVTVELLAPDGSVADGASGSGNSFELGSDSVQEGTWRLVVSTDSAHSGGSYEGTLETTYESA